MIAALFLAATVSAGPPAPGAAPLPFEFHLALEDQEAFERPASRRPRSDAVAVYVRWPRENDGEGRVDLFQERREAYPHWRWIDAAPSGSGKATLSGQTGRRSLILWRLSGAGGYRIAGPFSWPAQSRPFDLSPAPARAFFGADPAIASAGEILFVRSARMGDPLCETDAVARWQCLAIPESVVGVLVHCASGRERRFAEVRDGGSGNTRLEKAGWAAAVRIEAVSQEGSPDAPSSVAFSLASPGPGGGQIRTATALPALRLGPALHWIQGPWLADSEVIGRQPGRSGRIPLEDLVSGPCGEPVRFPLPRTLGVHGTVSEASGKPLSGASLIALEMRAPGPGAEPRPLVLASVRADGEGAYLFQELDPHVSKIRACHARAGCLDKPMPAVGDVLDFSLAPQWSFTGRVVSQGGVPQAEAHLRFLPTLEQYAKASDRLLYVPPEVDAESDSSGRFAISPPAAGSYLLEARSASAGTARRTIEVTTLSPSRTDLGDVVLSGAGEFLARLSGTGCAGGSLTLLGPVGVTSLSTMRDFALDAGGVARIELPEGGAWIVQARCADGLRLVNPEILSNVQDLYGQEVRLELGPLAFEKPRNPTPRH